jgi:hypothetical protein
VIDQQAILDAAERVVGRSCAANVTLDAVALEAGISKASVIYVVDRAFQRDREHHARVEEALPAGPSPAIRGRILAAAEPPPEAFRAVALNLSAALTLDDGLRRKMRANQAETIGRILETSASDRGALLAYLALEGLKFLEYLDFHHFARDERDRIIREIQWLVTAVPGEAALSDLATD